MTSVLPLEWHYAVLPDERERLGKDTTLVARVTGDDYTILGIFPGTELAEKFLEVLVVAPQESLFDAPVVVRQVECEAQPR
jgi:hypothetical protein